jgi:hypothetical protein
MEKLDMPTVLFDSGRNGTPGVSNVDLPTLTVDAVYTGYFQEKGLLEGPKEISDLSRREAHSVCIIF